MKFKGSFCWANSGKEASKNNIYFIDMRFGN